jgi:hypothetical protein
MKKILINTAKIHINSDCVLFDPGELENVEISVDANVTVQYCCVPKSGTPLTRHVDIASGSQFTGSAVILYSGSAFAMTTNILWDEVTSQLLLLAIATSKAQLSVEWVAKVDKPYRKVSTRVDQTNILLWKESRIRAIPKLEIATEDIEWWHSCKIHRLGGESAFYLESRWLTKKHAEALLLNSEILKHLDTISDEEEKRKVCYEIHSFLLEQWH